MFRNVAESLVFLLIKHKKLDIKDRDIYIYGLEVILLNGSLLISFLIMSIWLDMIFHFVGFLIFFLPLRIFVGGYHSKRSEVCFIISNAMYLLTLVIVKNYLGLHNNINVVIVTFVALIITYIWSPVRNKNRPLADCQYKRNKKIALVIILVDFALLLILLKFNFNMASSAIVFSLLNCGIFLIGKLSNIFDKIVHKKLGTG